MTATAINLLSVRDPSHLHDIEIRNGLAGAINIGTSANNSSCNPPDTNGCLSQGIGIDNTYIQTATSGTLSADQVVVSGNQVEIGPNVKIINSGPNPNGYSGLVIQPSGLDVGEGLSNSFFAGSVAGYAICVLITSPNVTANAGAQGNVIGPGNSFERCKTATGTGYGVELTGVDSSHQAVGNYVFGNYYLSTTDNTVYIDQGNNNWIWEKGAAGNINLTAHSAGNNIFSLVGQATGTLTGNRVITFPDSTSATVMATNFTTTAAATNNVTVTGMTASGHCSLQPTNNSAAAGIASAFISAKTTNQITVTHTATAGWAFDVLCTPN